MKVVTLTRTTPDTAAKVVVDDNGAVSWGSTKPVVNPWDEYAIEEAIVQAKEAGGTATALAIGAEQHEDALKQSLAMGVKEAIRIDIDTTDSLTYATVAAAAIEKVGDVDLVICGKEAIDVDSDLHIYQTARKLGWTMLAYVSQILEVDYEAKTIKVEKMLEQGKQILTAKLPAVISVMKDINEPRYPTLMGIRKASRAKLPVWSADDLGLALPEAKTSVSAYENPPAQDVTTEIIEGVSPAEKAVALVDKLIGEQVL